MAIIVVDQTPQPGQMMRPTFNFQHFTTPHGGLLVIQFVVAIIIFCIGPPLFLNIISWIAWIITHTLIWVYLFSIQERYVSNPPLKVVEFYFNCGTCVLYGLSTFFCFISVAWINAVFGIVNTCAYGASAFFLFADWREHRGNASATGTPTIPK